MNIAQNQITGDKTIAEWNLLWIRVPNGLKCHQSHLTEDVGLYHFTLNDRSKALGTGAGKKGGIAKRLSDFIRFSWSGRSHSAGRRIYEHRDQLETWVLITGSGPYARRIARLLKAAMTAIHQPDWNASRPRSVSKTKAKVRRWRSAVVAQPTPGPTTLPRAAMPGATQPPA